MPDNNPSRATKSEADFNWIRKIVLQVILTATGALIALWLIYALRSVLILLAFTIIFCYLVNPLVELVERLPVFRRREIRIPRWLAVAIVYLGLIVSLFFTLERIVPLLTEQLTAFFENMPGYARGLNQYVQWLTALPSRYRLPANWKQSLIDSLNGASLNLVEWVKLVIAKTLQVTLYLPWLVLIPVIGFFFLKDAKMISDKLLTSFPHADKRYRVALFLKDVSATLAAYIRAQLLACLIVGFIEGIGLWLLGIPYPLVFGVGAGLLEFVPIVGPLTLGIVACFVAGFASWRHALLIGGFLALFRIIHDYVIYPRLISEGIEMHPVVVILAVLCGAELGGVVGVFLSVPVMALLIVCYRHWRDLQLDRSAVLVKVNDSSLIESELTRD
jgi:predicted PurR-regulated permease PerM